MVDSNDRDRAVEARDELHRMLNEVLGEPYLVLIFPSLVLKFLILYVLS